MTMWYLTSTPMGAANGRYRQTATTTSGSTAGTSSTTYAGTVTIGPLSGPFWTTGTVATGEPCPYAVEEAGIRAGEIIGYRAWHLVKRPDGPRLRSIFMQYVWTPGGVERVFHVDRYFGAGLHAFKTLEEAIRQCSLHASCGQVVVFGEIAMWGEVIEHEHGYRSEYAMVRQIISVLDGALKSLWFPKLREQRRLQQLRQIYKV